MALMYKKLYQRSRKEKKRNETEKGRKIERPCFNEFTSKEAKTRSKEEC